MQGAVLQMSCCSTIPCNSTGRGLGSILFSAEKMFICSGHFHFNSTFMAYGAILNHRLNNFLKHTDLLKENQAGFRSGYSTVDHIFALHILTELLKQKKLFCLFVDYSKAFDSVRRVGLWKW